MACGVDEYFDGNIGLCSKCQELCDETRIQMNNDCFVLCPAMFHRRRTTIPHSSTTSTDSSQLYGDGNKMQIILSVCAVTFLIIAVTTITIIVIIIRHRHRSGEKKPTNSTVCLFCWHCYGFPDVSSDHTVQSTEMLSNTVSQDKNQQIQIKNESPQVTNRKTYNLYMPVRSKETSRIVSEAPNLPHSLSVSQDLICSRSSNIRSSLCSHSGSLRHETKLENCRELSSEHSINEEQARIVTFPTHPESDLSLDCSTELKCTTSDHLLGQMGRNTEAAATTCISLVEDNHCQVNQVANLRGDNEEFSLRSRESTESMRMRIHGLLQRIGWVRQFWYGMDGPRVAVSEEHRSSAKRDIKNILKDEDITTRDFNFEVVSLIPGHYSQG